MGENHSSVRQPFPVLLTGRRIGECGGGIVCDGSERHFMGKADQYSIIAGMMNVDGSVFREKLRTAGIHCDASASVMMEAEKPFLVFEMTDSSPKDAERFRQVSDETLCEMQERGIDPSVVETALKARSDT
ncbi:MAG: hypothetical protein ACLT76_01970 [Clostridium fessum]